MKYEKIDTYKLYDLCVSFLQNQTRENANNFLIDIKEFEKETQKQNTQFPSGAYTLEKDKKTGEIRKVDFLEKLMSL